MSEKARGALFNILGDISGFHVLDVFAGSGALSFEALSRGAQQVVAIDSDKNAQAAIAGNTKALGLQSRLTLVRASANAWLQTSSQTDFDLILCDPPYNDLQANLVAQLSERLRAGGLQVLSWPSSAPLPDLPLTFLQARNYGDAQLAFYRRLQ